MTNSSRLFELLAAGRRRQILFLLCGSESIQVPEGLQTRGATQVQDPGDDHASPTAGRDRASPDQSLQQLEIELYHLHLPKLEAQGVIEWNQEMGTVSRGLNFEQIEPALRGLATNAMVFPDDLF